jgi:hypothetical protein
LDTLTSRSQETIFENFARRLAQCEVCPNLLPHTGPNQHRLNHTSVRKDGLLQL